MGEERLPRKFTAIVGAGATGPALGKESIARWRKRHALPER